MAAGRGISFLVALVALQIFLSPTFAAPCVNPRRLRLTATPRAFLIGPPPQDITLTCQILSGPEDLTTIVTGLRISRRPFGTPTIQTVATITAGGAATSSIAGITATGTVTATRTGSTLSVVLPAATATAQLGLYYCNYVTSGPLVSRPRRVFIRQRQMNFRELRAFVLAQTATCNCQTEINALTASNTALQTAVSGLQTSVTTVNNVIEEQFTKSDWPAGSYALLKPESGCPDDAAFRDEQTSYIGLETELTANTNFNAAYFGTHLSSPVITTINQPFGNYIYMRFCPTTNTLSTSAWPAGSYCINKGAGACPAGFADGSFTFTGESSDGANFATSGGPGTAVNIISFCCRSDAPAATAITLPTDTPFFLYRVGATCQAITGMTVTPEALCIDTEDTSNMDTPTGVVPTLTDQPAGEVILNFCYYVRT